MTTGAAAWGMRQVRASLIKSGTGAEKLAGIDRSLAALDRLGVVPVEPVSPEEWQEAAGGAQAAADQIVAEQQVTRAKAQAAAGEVARRARAVREAALSGAPLGSGAADAAAVAVGLKPEPVVSRHPAGVVARNGPDPALIGSGVLWRWQGEVLGSPGAPALVADPNGGRTLSLEAGDVVQEGQVLSPLPGSGARVVVSGEGVVPFVVRDAGGGVWQQEGFPSGGAGGGAAGGSAGGGAGDAEGSESPAADGD